jgi:hypothetical protein
MNSLAARITDTIRAERARQLMPCVALAATSKHWLHGEMARRATNRCTVRTQARRSQDEYATTRADVR